MKLLKYKNIVGAIAIILVAVGIYYLFFMSKTSVLKDLEPEFTGYDKAGVMEYDMASINDKILDAIMKEELPKDDYEDMKDDLELAREEMYSSSSYKLKKVKSMFEKVRVEVDKVNDLANGDKVTFKVKAPKKSPVKSETKTFTVKGLEPAQEITIKDLLAETPIEYKGYNGFAEAKLPDSSKLAFLEETDKLSNGDKIKLEVTQIGVSELKSQGKIIDKKHQKDVVTVSGLKELSTITNLDEAYKKIDVSLDDYYSKGYSADSVTVEPQGNYIKADESSVSVYTIYKITSTDKDKKEETWYQSFGYDSFEVNNDKVTFRDFSYFNNDDKSSSLESAKQKLERRNFIEYKK